MRNAFHAAALVLAVLGAPEASSAAPQAKSGCQARALTDLERLSPRGYDIYRAVTDKKQFLAWLTCDDLQLGLSTGVHESVHLLTQERDAFPLIGGGNVSRPHQVSKFFPPKDIARNFEADDSYVRTYLRPGNASSANDFLYMLDEMNAYSHDLNSAVKLVSLQPHDRQVDHRDGLTAVMAFVVSYVDTARKSRPETWQGLHVEAPRQTLKALWAQAETVLESSCGLPAFGQKDRGYIAFIDDPKNNAALAELIGKAPAIPDECVPTITSSAKKH